MKMYLKSLCVITILLLAFTACGRSEETETSTYDNELVYAPYSDIEGNSPQTHIGVNPHVNFIGNMRLSNAYDFSENRAWVQHTTSVLGNSVNISLLIDTQGQILWESDPTEGQWGHSNFKDGLAILHRGGSTVYRFREVAIIDINGNITYSRTQNNFGILGYGGGLFLVAEHISDFHANEWRIGAIDKYGNIVVPLQAYACANGRNLNINEWVRCIYLGNGIFNLSFRDWREEVVINITEQRVILNSNDLHSIQRFSGFENGYAIVAVNETPWRGLTVPGIYRIGLNGNPNGRLANDWTQGQLYNFYEGLTYIYRDTWGTLSSHLGGAFYNAIGIRVIEFPEFYGVRPFRAHPFINGHSILEIQGADGQWYISAINRRGEMLFELVTGYSEWQRSNDGRYILLISQGSLLVSTITGFPLIEINSRYVDTVGMRAGAQYDVSNGFIRINNFFVNIHDGTIIGHPYYVYNENFMVYLFPQDNIPANYGIAAHDEVGSFELQQAAYEGMISLPRGWTFDSMTGYATSQNDVVMIVRRDEGIQIQLAGEGEAFLFNDGNTGIQINLPQQIFWINGDVLITIRAVFFQQGQREYITNIARTLTDPLRTGIPADMVIPYIPDVIVQTYEGMLSVPQGWRFDSVTGYATGPHVTLRVSRDEGIQARLRGEGEEFLFDDGNVGLQINQPQQIRWVNGDVVITMPAVHFQETLREAITAVARTLTDPLRTPGNPTDSRIDAHHPAMPSYIDADLLVGQWELDIVMNGPLDASPTQLITFFSGNEGYMVSLGFYDLLFYWTIWDGQLLIESQFGETLYYIELTDMILTFIYDIDANFYATYRRVE